MTINNNKKTLVSAVEAALIAHGHIKAPSAQAVQEIPSVLPKDNLSTVESEKEAKDPQEGTLETSAEELVTGAVEGPQELPTVVEYLQEQVAAKDEEIFTLKFENKQLSEELNEQAKATEGLVQIAVQSINAMQVALGKTVTTYDKSSSAKDILIAHARVSADFKKSFPVGGVAAIQPETKEIETEKVVRDSQWAAKIAATSL